MKGLSLEARVITVSVVLGGLILLPVLLPKNISDVIVVPHEFMNPSTELDQALSTSSDLQRVSNLLQNTQRTKSAQSVYWPASDTTRHNSARNIVVSEPEAVLKSAQVHVPRDAVQAQEPATMPDAAVPNAVGQEPSTAAGVSTAVTCQPESVGYAPGLNTSLCYDSQGCQGRLTVQRYLCPKFPREVAREEGLHGPIHALGPDAFRVRLEGAEVVMVNMRHIGDCKYEGSFFLTLPGQYCVQAFTMFENFHGHADFPYAKPAYNPQLIVKPKYVLHCVAPSRPWVPPKALPLCHTLMAPGRWVRPPGAPLKGPGPTAVGGWPAKWVKHGVIFASEFGGTFVWQPYDCQYRDFSQDQVAHALKGKRIMYIGDSQTRSMFYPLVNAINENKILGNPKIVDQNPNNQGWIEFAVRGGITVRYYLDNFLAATKNSHSLTWQSLIQETHHAWDIMVLGMGNWAMCGNLANKGVGLWSLQRYYKEIDRIAQQLRVYADRTGTRVLWHNQPNFPWEVDAYRNGARLRLFNTYATDRMISAGFEVFDSFNISDGMLHTAIGYPQGHFNSYHVRDNWARVVLSYLVDHPTPPVRPPRH